MTWVVERRLDHGVICWVETEFHNSPYELSNVAWREGESFARRNINMQFPETSNRQSIRWGGAIRRSFCF